MDVCKDAWLFVPQARFHDSDKSPHLTSVILPPKLFSEGYRGGGSPSIAYYKANAVFSIGEVVSASFSFTHEKNWTHLRGSNKHSCAVIAQEVSYPEQWRLCELRPSLLQSPCPFVRRDLYVGGMRTMCLDKAPKGTCLCSLRSIRTTADGSTHYGLHERFLVTRSII